MKREKLIDMLDGRGLCCALIHLIRPSTAQSSLTSTGTILARGQGGTQIKLCCYSSMAKVFYKSFLKYKIYYISYYLYKFIFEDTVLRQSLSRSFKADWRILKNIPAFGSCAFQPFLARLHKATATVFGSLPEVLRTPIFASSVLETWWL